jgi:hypothetical protein
VGGFRGYGSGKAVVAAQLMTSGRQRTVKLAVKADWWNVLKGCYERLRTGWATPAPQLDAPGDFLRQLTTHPREWRARPPTTSTA